MSSRSLIGNQSSPVTGRCLLHRRSASSELCDPARPPWKFCFRGPPLPLRCLLAMGDGRWAWLLAVHLPCSSDVVVYPRVVPTCVAFRSTLRPKSKIIRRAARGAGRGVAERGGAGRGAVQRARNTRAASGVSESRGTSKARCPTRTSFLVGNSVSVSTVNTPKPPPPTARKKSR